MEQESFGEVGMEGAGRRIQGGITNTEVIWKSHTKSRLYGSFLKYMQYICKWSLNNGAIL